MPSFSMYITVQSNSSEHCANNIYLCAHFHSSIYEKMFIEHEYVVKYIDQNKDGKRNTEEISVD